MVRRAIKRVSIAKSLGCKYATLTDKLNGKSDFTLSEIVIIRDKYFDDLKLDYLFEKFPVEEKEVVNE